MSVRHLLHGILTSEAPVNTLYGGKIIDSGELGETAGTIPTFPFLVTVFGEETRGASRTSRLVQVELWSYDEPRDRTRTGKGLDAVYAVLHQRAGGSVLVDGVTTHLIEALWQARSKDFTDDVLRASVKYDTYKLAINQ